MSNYTKSTNFATKDNLSPGDPLKIVRGTEIDTEFNNISTAISTKTDNSAAAITGGSITGITDLAIADGGTGASTATAALNNLLPSQTSNANKYLQTDGTNATWDAVSLSTSDITGTLPVANGGTGVTSSTGTGNVVLSNSPTLVTPALGTPASGVATNLTGLPLTTGVTGTLPVANGGTGVTTSTGTGNVVLSTSPTLVTPALGTPSALVGTNITGTASGLTAGNVTINANLTGAVTSVGNATSLGSFTSAQLLGALTDETGTGSAVFATSPTLVTPILGTPTSATLTNATGLPISTGVSGLGTGVATFLATPSSANLRSALTDETGTGSAVFATSPTLVTPVLGTPTSATLTNATGLPLTTGVTGTLPTANGGTNLTSFTSGGVVYASSTSALATGSALTFAGGVFEINAASAYLKVTTTTGTSFFGDAPSLVSGAGASDTAIRFDGSNLIFSASNLEKMRLTSAGNVGIGTSSPATKLDFGVTTNGTQIVNLRKNSNSVAGLGVNVQYGVRIAGPSDSDAPVSFGEIDVADGTTFSEFMRLNSDGALKTYSTISVGNATPSSSGAGITFPATQSASSDANTLDDYEEGTFTPTIASDVGSVTLSTAVGKYTKIGRQVTITANVVVSASTAASNVYLASLPFTSGSTNPGSFYGYSFSADQGTPMVEIDSGVSQAVIQKTNGSGSVATFGPVLQANSAMFITLTYFV